MKINFNSMLNMGVIEPNKLTEVYVDGQRVWKGLSENLTIFDEEYDFCKFNNKKLNTFNEAEYKIEITPKKKILVEAKKSFEDEMEYGLPEDKKYPLFDKAHVLSAIKFFNYCKESEKQKTLADAIISKMEKYGISFDSVGDDNNLKKFLPTLEESMRVLNIDLSNKEEVEVIHAKTEEYKILIESEEEDECDEESKHTEVVNNLRKDIQGEFDAIIDYDKRADIADNAGYTELADTLRDIRDEEKVHVGELQHELKKIDDTYEKSLESGEKEAAEEAEEKKDDKLEEEISIKGGRYDNKKLTTIDGKPLKSLEDGKERMIRMGDDTGIISSDDKFHFVGKDAKKDTDKGHDIKVTREINVNGFTYKGDQITPAIERAHERQVKEAEEVKSLLKKKK